MERAMDSDIQKNTSDIILLDKRMSSHETMCEERWKTCFNRFDDMDTVSYTHLTLPTRTRV